MNPVEMPDRMMEDLVRLIGVSEGRLGRKRREGEFEKLTDDEIVSVEDILRDAFEDFEGSAFTGLSERLAFDGYIAVLVT